MAIGLTEEHEALAASVRGLVERHITGQVVRGEVESPRHEGRPGFWPALADQGLLGLHLPEEHGGQGYGLVEQAVALEELGRALAPGPYVPTVLASAAIAAYGTDKARADLLPSLADGSRTAAVVLRGDFEAVPGDDGLRIEGAAGTVLGAPLADLLVLPLGGDRWAVVDAADAVVETGESLDLTRPVGSVRVEGVTVPQDRILQGPVRDLAVVVLGAEACGIAGRATEDAAAYAKIREQFGRPIGQFQGVKHKVARMLIATERARAAVWDAARAVDAGQEPGQREYAVGVAGALAGDAAVTCAEDNIQVHGGIGYTFEHDAHLIYRRALTLRALTGRACAHHARVARLALDGLRRPIEIDLPEDAAPLRERIRAQVAELAAMDPFAQRAAMAEGGWVTPHLPRPWGRDAGPLEQVVIQQELRRANVRPVPLMIAAWVVPSLVQYGTPEQQERFLPPTLRGEILWCQLFSEPGAGSDLAGLTTRAEKVEGGWRITGQKIWNSLAREAQWGICIARTDPAAPKHEGITYFLVDMASAGIEVRPLRECTGEAVFNEVFLDGVFVPDELVVGPVGQGWRVARNTLANERVGLTSSFQLGASLTDLVALIEELDLAADPLVLDGLGRLAADEHAYLLLGLRATLRQLSGTDPGATANVRKLVAMEHGQRVTEYGFTLLGEEGALTGDRRSGLRRRWTFWLLASRAMTIGGGTTEVNLNVIGERILGLPRDPEPVRR
ncbi:acyl-CoA dehydrogenase [Thermomonospora cellulosilytica]|uniref:Alkylation response protein AidB-like acyl-CoA dehydrogenase n=1 Tax=Thermomonospora cellulosilytica TaxID=1411118 RepID=A0A7W3N5A9_9ACTN|nr:acyl-CoA dehydrogenase [Thermomonospora cellulosilytica]MBA9007841.1 alkylation response protein AidB-like acyl-CoA dehydrogenase [Thermomonospora cellulosilytica]